MIDDPNIEYEPNQEFDENGEPIFYIEKDYTADEFTSYNFNQEPPAFPDSYYESVWDTGTGVSALADDETTGEELTDRIELEDELKDSVDSQQENTINQAQESYNNAVDTIINVLTEVLAKGEITSEDNATILQAQSVIANTEEQIKRICNENKTLNITEQLEKIRENMVGATVDDILNILTANGTKPWLYKDDNNNVLVDMQSIPELTVLVNKLNLIATGGDEASEIQLTPEFINLISTSDIKFTAKNITLEGLVTANENFKILEDGSMRAKNGYFTGQIFVGDGSVIGDEALSDGIRQGASDGTLAIEKLETVDADIKNLKADKANITDLNATNANISNLNATVGNIQTLVNGNLTSDNIQSMVITGDKFTVANGFIKNAMIDSVSANKINTGTINTNNVLIQSEDGSMIINGTTQQFKDENNVVRIQIGKDATGNFTFCLFSQDGKGILLDADGIKAGAVPDGLIVNDMVADNANISGGKLDISSVISSINNNENTLKSSKIKFDDTEQTLDIAFNQLKSKVETIENITVDGNLSSVIEQVTSNTTSISVMQGQISSLISNTTITKQDGTVTQLKDEFNSVKDTVNSHTQTINSHESTLTSVSAKQTEFEQNLDGFKQTVSETYATKDEIKSITDNVGDYMINISKSMILLTSDLDGNIIN